MSTNRNSTPACNGAPGCDIGNGTSLDINGNTVPDECEGFFAYNITQDTLHPSIADAIALAIDSDELIAPPVAFATEPNIDYLGKAIILGSSLAITQPLGGIYLVADNATLASASGGAITLGGELQVPPGNVILVADLLTLQTTGVLTMQPGASVDVEATGGIANSGSMTIFGLLASSGLVHNQALGTKGKSDFFLPRIGLEARRNTNTSALHAGLSMEINFGGVAGTAVGTDLDILGRNDADADFAIFQWDGASSFYLEPILNRTAWRDPSSPESSTLAHAVAFSFKGQWAFDYRLIPNFQQVAGGLYSVRGYPQSAAAGDTVVIGSAEYRFHLPRLLPVRPGAHTTAPTSRRGPLHKLGGFRVAPEHVWGRPDWDLIFRVFVDSAFVHASDAFGFEPNETLLSAGGGIELQILRNLSLRFDAGFALSDLSDGRTRRGDSELYLVGTVLY